MPQGCPGVKRATAEQQWDAAKPEPPRSRHVSLNRRGADGLSPGSGDEPSPPRGSWAAAVFAPTRIGTMNGMKALVLMFRPEFMWWFLGSEAWDSPVPCRVPVVSGLAVAAAAGGPGIEGWYPRFHAGNPGRDPVNPGFSPWDWRIPASSPGCGSGKPG
jgi:hypothetical protein